LRFFPRLPVLRIQALWLSQAARLELAAQSVYREVWAAGLVFFGGNCWVLGELVGAYDRNRAEAVASGGRRKEATAKG